jgi:hypothetical protein
MYYATYDSCVCEYQNLPIRYCLYSESTLRLCASRRLCAEFKIVKFKSLVSVRTKWYSIWTLISQATIRLDVENFPSGRPSVSRASISSSLHTSGRHGNMSERSSKFQKNPAFKCIRPDDVAIPSERQSVFNK